MANPQPSASNVTRVALITGGTRNLGLAIAEALGGLGFRIVVVYRTDTVQAEATVRRLAARGVAARAVRADVTDEACVHQLFDGVRNEEGRLDVLVNNVGSFLWKPLDETTLGEWEDILRSNLTSAFLCTKASLPLLRARGGQIISIASMHAEVLRAVPNTLPYAIAKTGLVLLTKSLAKSEARHGIRANAVCPGFVDCGTTQVDPTTIPIGRPAGPAEIARVVRFLATDEASYVTGAVIDVHGGALL